MADDVILATSDLTKEFKGFTAVNGVSLNVRRGTIHALIGPNGAGKTTCFNLLTKFLAPTKGRIEYNGRDITALAPADIARLGLVRSFQISAVFPHLTALENVRIALQRKRGDSFDFWRSERVLRSLDAEALRLVDAVGLSEFADIAAVELSYGRKRALEIATTLALDPEMLLLDEPMAGMGREDVDRIAALIRRVSADRTVLMVEHNLSVVASLSDFITVLARGSVLAEGDYATVSKDPASSRPISEPAAMPEAALASRAPAPASAPLLVVEDLHAWYGESHVLHGIRFDVRPGEVVTLLGRNGAGKTTTLKSIIGIIAKRTGSIVFDGKETIRLPSRAIARLGVGYVPEERGIFSSLSVEENLDLPPQVKPGGLSKAQIFELFPNVKERLTSQGTKLSGGEQQMLSIARILRTGANFLLLDEPTEGLAPVIVEQIGRTIRRLKGKASPSFWWSRTSASLPPSPTGTTSWSRGAWWT
jgi:branched-chain amino acid transport system ATP-binding protein